MKRRVIFFLVLICLGIEACDDDFDQWGYVNMYIEPDTTEYYNLNIGNRGWEYLQGGNRGVIVYRHSYQEFHCYERSCTLSGCNGRLEVDEQTNALIICPQCGSRFLCVDGSPLTGSKAKRMLYEYCSAYDGWRLYVHNCYY